MVLFLFLHSITQIISNKQIYIFLLNFIGPFLQLVVNQITNPIENMSVLFFIALLPNSIYLAGFKPIIILD